MSNNEIKKKIKEIAELYANLIEGHPIRDHNLLHFEIAEDLNIALCAKRVSEGMKQRKKLIND